MARVIVIGAGLSGLAAAARLARLRHEVTVCERSSGPGGLAGRFDREGFAFDTGPTHLHLPAGYRDLFIKTGKTTPLENFLELVPQDPAATWRFADGTVLRMPNATRAGTMTAVGNLMGPHAATAWDDFLATGEQLWTAFRSGLVHPPPDRPWVALRSRAGRDRLRALTPARTLQRLHARQLTEPRLRQAAESWILRLGADPRRAPAALAFWPALEHTFGLWRVEGGVRRLVDVLADRARSRGAEFRYDTAVVAIDHDRAARGVRLADGTSLPADIVVCATDEDTCRRLLGRRPAPRRTRSASALTLLLALDGGGPTGPEVVFSPDSDRELATVFGRGEPARDPTVFLAPAAAPAGATACTATVITPRHGHGRGEVDWPARGADYAGHVLDSLCRRGLDLRERLLWSHVRTPADLEGETGAPGGALSSPVLHGRAALLFRSANRDPIAGVFRVGGSAHPGPGVAFAPLGSALIAEMIGRAR